MRRRTFLATLPAIGFLSSCSSTPKIRLALNWKPDPQFGGFYAAVTIGISISFGILDIVNIAHPAFIILGSYIAYILNINGIIKDADVMNKDTIMKVQMPNRDGFVDLYPGKF